MKSYAEIAKAMQEPSIPDSDLIEILAFFYDLEAKLTALGPVWSLARFQTYRELSTFEGYATMRGWDLNKIREEASK
jgi:hypothetical protein